MPATPYDIYVEIMSTIRRRLDIIDMLRSSDSDAFSKSETAAFHGRKVVEGIAFACLVATDNGIGQVPREARGQWNAEHILRSLSRKKITTFPSPSVIRIPTERERQELDVKAVIEGVPERRITSEELQDIYQQLHRWLHEVNPYIEGVKDEFCRKHSERLWADLSRVHTFIDSHVTSICGEGFFCVLRDRLDGRTKIQSLSKIASSLP